MIIVYLLYGLSFLLLSAGIAVQALTTVRVLPVRAMLFLSLFGLLHGSAEWLEIVRRYPEYSGYEFRWISLGLIAGSYVALTAFGVELLVKFVPLPGYCRAVTLFLTALWIGFWGWHIDLSADQAFTALEVGARYFLGFTGSILSSMGLFAVAETRTGEMEGRLRAGLRWSAAFFAAYGLLAGLIVPELPTGLASILNVNAFFRGFGFPVIVLRTACALAISAALIQAFVVEVSRLNALWGSMREEFISLIAHDLKSSLSGVTLATELLVEELPRYKETPERLEKIARQIQVTTKGLSTIVADLLDASLIAANRLHIRKEQVDLGALTGAGAERLRLEFAGREVRLELPKEPLVITADPVRLNQVLLNLFSNVKKYAKPGTPVVISLQRRGARALLMVANQAESVNADELPHLFDRYYRMTGSYSRAEGTGLGLYIVKGLVEAHGGTVGVKSLGPREIGFFVSFPLS